MEGPAVREGAQWHGGWLAACVGETGGDVADLCIQELLDRAEASLREGVDVLSNVCQLQDVSGANGFENTDPALSCADAQVRDELGEGALLAEMRRHLNAISLLRGQSDRSTDLEDGLFSFIFMVVWMSVTKKREPYLTYLCICRVCVCLITMLPLL